MAETKPISVRVEQDIFDLIKNKSENEGVTMSDVARSVLAKSLGGETVENGKTQDEDQEKIGTKDFNPVLPFSEEPFDSGFEGAETPFDDEGPPPWVGEYELDSTQKIESKENSGGKKPQFEPGFHDEIESLQVSMGEVISQLSVLQASVSGFLAKMNDDSGKPKDFSKQLSSLRGSIESTVVEVLQSENEQVKNELTVLFQQLEEGMKAYSQTQFDSLKSQLEAEKETTARLKIELEAQRSEISTHAKAVKTNLDEFKKLLGNIAKASKPTLSARIVTGFQATSWIFIMAVVVAAFTVVFGIYSAVNHVDEYFETKGIPKIRGAVNGELRNVMAEEDARRKKVEGRKP